MDELYDADHWLKRAEHARMISAILPIGSARQAMLQVAANYDDLAKRATARRKAEADEPSAEIANGTGSEV